MEIEKIKEILKFEDVGDFHEGYVKIKKGEKYNFLDMSGEFLFKEWLEYLEVGDFHEGYASVYKRDIDGQEEYNFIDKKGNLLFSEWLNSFEDMSYSYTLGDFHEGYAKICGEDVNGYIYNFIDKNGKILLDKRLFCNKYSFVGDFFNGHALISNTDLCVTNSPFEGLMGDGENYYDEDNVSIDENEYMKEQYRSGYRDEYALKNVFEYIDINGKITAFDENKGGVSDKNDGTSSYYYENIRDFSEEYALVKDKNRYNFLKKNGKLLFNEWLNFEDVGDFHGGYARVKNNNKWNFIDKQGRLLFDECLDYEKVGSFGDGYFYVYKSDKGGNFIDENGKILFVTGKIIVNYPKEDNGDFLF